MKNPIINILFFAFTLLLTTSCDRTLHVDTDQLPKLVLNGLLRVGEPVKVELSKTRNLFDQEDEIDWVRNADVLLTRNGENIVEKLVYEGEGIYYSENGKVVEFGDTYSIEVVHTVYENITATAELPEPTIGKVSFKGSEGDQQNFELNIQNPNPDNFFIWEMIQNGQNGTENIEIISFDSNTDNILPDESQSQERIFLEALDLVQTDDINSIFGASGIDDDNIPTLEIHLITVNEEMYKYYRSIELYKNSTKRFINPVEIYSNIENGLGMFGAVSHSIIPVTF